MYHPTGTLAATGVATTVPAWVATGSSILAAVVLMFALLAAVSIVKIGDRS